jgi:hypothetical protein
MELRMHFAAILLDACMGFNRNDYAHADSTYLALCLYILSEKEGIHAYLRPHYERQLRQRIPQTIKEMEELSPEGIRFFAMNMQRMRNISALSNVDSTVDRTILGPLSQTRGTVAPVESDEVADELEGTESIESKMLKPTKHHLIDPVTLVIFYFPTEPEQDGLALIIPSGGRKAKPIPLGLDRKKLHIQSQAGTLRSALSGVWEEIKEEAKQASPFLPFLPKGSEDDMIMRQSVVISWSDESCWHRDSRERITVDMFPFDVVPDNVTVQ